jgi:hypothetical protein
VKHTLTVHDQTPLTNHMGLRVLIGHDIGSDKESGRMRYTKDTSMTDPFETWKRMRIERYKDYKPVAYALLATSLFAFVAVLRRTRSLWIAQCLAQVWIILLSQLTCYYYSFMVALAPITRLRRDLEIWIFGFAALSQVIWRVFGFNDDRYTVLTLVSLVLCYGVIFALAPREQDAKEAPFARGWRSMLDWSGPRLGALVSFVPGLVFTAMGGMRRDLSTVILGSIAMFAGAGLWGWAGKLRQAATPADGSKPKSLASAAG